MACVLFHSSGLTRIQNRPCSGDLRAEVAPAPLRGFTVMLLIQFLGIGTILAAVIVNATAKMPTKAGWMIPVGIQFLPTVILAVLLPFTVGE
jgi:SP family sugar:H+ symporter-like MFS transporter